MTSEKVDLILYSIMYIPTLMYSLPIKKLKRYKSRWGDITIIWSVSMFRENRLKTLMVAEKKSFHCRVTSVRAFHQSDFASNWLWLQDLD